MPRPTSPARPSSSMGIKHYTSERQTCQPPAPRGPSTMGVSKAHAKPPPLPWWPSLSSHIALPSAPTMEGVAATSKYSSVKHHQICLPLESCLEGVNRQSNLKHTWFKQLKTAGPDMFGFRSDMSGLRQICLILGPDMSDHQKLRAMKK
jgi:hypothetical protein